MSGSSRFPKENLTLLLVRESSARRREAGFRFNSEYDHTIVDNGFDECKIEDDYNGYNDNKNPRWLTTTGRSSGFLRRGESNRCTQHLSRWSHTTQHAQHTTSVINVGMTIMIIRIIIIIFISGITTTTVTTTKMFTIRELKTWLVWVISTRPESSGTFSSDTTTFKYM